MLKKLFLLSFIGGLIYLGVSHTSEVQYQVANVLHLSSAKVQGASTEAQKSVSSQVHSEVQSLSKQGLNVKVKDIISGVVNAQTTIVNLEKSAQEQIHHFFKKKRHSAGAVYLLTI